MDLIFVSLPFEPFIKKRHMAQNVSPSATADCRLHSPIAVHPRNPAIFVRNPLADGEGGKLLRVP